MLFCPNPRSPSRLPTVKTCILIAARWLDRENFFYTADGRIKRREFGLRFAEEVPFKAQIEVRRDAYPIRKQDFNDTANRPVTGITGISPTGDGRLIVSALGDLWELSCGRHAVETTDQRRVR